MGQCRSSAFQTNETTALPSLGCSLWMAFRDASLVIGATGAAAADGGGAVDSAAELRDDAGGAQDGEYGA